MFLALAEMMAPVLNKLSQPILTPDYRGGSWLTIEGCWG